MKKFTEEQISQANQVSLLELVKRLGYQPEKRGINYHIRDYGGLYISDQKNSFYCWAQEHGGGPIQFLMKFENMRWVEAMKYLVGEDEIQQSNNSVKWQKPPEENPIEFKLPEKSSTSYNRLFAYLLKTRGLDKDIVSDLVHKKKIYESSTHHNAVYATKNKIQTNLVYPSNTGVYCKKIFGFYLVMLCHWFYTAEASQTITSIFPFF